MTGSDRLVFALELAKTAELFGEPVSEARGALYWEALEDLTIEEVVAGFRRARSHTPTFFPKPGEIRQLIEGTDADHAELAWRQFHQAVVQIGGYESVVFADPVIPEVIQSLFGGWPEACLLKTEELPFRHAEFVKTYRAMGKRSWPPAAPMLGRVAQDNLQRGFLEHVPVPRQIGTPERGLVRRAEAS